MSISRLIGKHWRVASVIVACWTFLGLIFTPQTYLVNLRSPTPLTWGQAFVATLLLFQVWAVLTPFVLWLGGRFPLEHKRLLRNLGIYLLLSALIAAKHLVLLQIVNF